LVGLIKIKKSSVFQSNLTNQSLDGNNCEQSTANVQICCNNIEHRGLIDLKINELDKPIFYFLSASAGIKDVVLLR